LGSIARYLKLGFTDNVDLATDLMENIHVIKFTSHDVNIIDFAIAKIGLNNTVGRIYRSAYTLQEFPNQQASLKGAVPPNLLPPSRTIITSDAAGCDNS
jgi:hypothetical protein